jgi:hypothetical protein
MKPSLLSHSLSLCLTMNRSSIVVSFAYFLLARARSEFKCTLDESMRPLDKMSHRRTLRKEQELQSERQRQSWTQAVDRSDIVP